MLNNEQNIDTQELKNFEALAKEWWDPQGKLKTLHHINPVRLRYVDQAVGLDGKSVLDLGCGGGLLTEAMVDKGARVTGLDASNSIIETAKLHQCQSVKEINYIVSTAEQYAQDNQETFDVITCMELVEHVPDAQLLISSCEKILKPGGHLILSTINRTLKSYVSAIIAAEYLLNLVPRGTHDYKKFIKPSEMYSWLRQSGFTVLDVAGLRYIPGINYCSITNNPSVNYFIHAKLKN